MTLSVGTGEFIINAFCTVLDTLIQLFSGINHADTSLSLYEAMTSAT